MFGNSFEVWWGEAASLPQHNTSGQKSVALTAVSTKHPRTPSPLLRRVSLFLWIRKSKSQLYIQTKIFMDTSELVACNSHNGTNCISDCAGKTPGLFGTVGPASLLWIHSSKQRKHVSLCKCYRLEIIYKSTATMVPTFINAELTGEHKNGS